MKTRTLYQIREYKTPNSYSTPVGTKLRDRHLAVRIIAFLAFRKNHKHRDFVMVPLTVRIGGKA